jgi:glutathione synthase/RimK-type ligase-like ATP-grasp enzyme
MGISAGKWTKYELMKKEEGLSSYLPETQLFSRESLWEFLDKFNQIIFKPSRGFQGSGIIQITSMEQDQYEIHKEINIIKLNGRSEIYDFLMKRQHAKRSYILQQKIQLAAIDGSPFDLRVMVQRKKDLLEWKVTGKIARVASKGFFITNAAKELLSAEEAIERSLLNKSPLNDILSEIDKVALLTAAHLEKHYVGCRVLGIDIGIDVNGRVWIIEANLNPRIGFFKYLKDKSIYKTINEYIRK